MASEVFSTNFSSGVVVTGVSPSQTKGPGKQVVVIMLLFLVIGVLGNLLALVKLARKRTNINGTYTLMLRFLTTYNLIGLLGMSIILIIKRCLPLFYSDYIQFFCASYVVLRFFGLSSGCVALIMSIDRYILLNHPHYYQMNLTPKSNRDAILALTFVAFILTVCPLFGFGIYFDEQKRQCLKYKQATTTVDRTYAFLFLVFGTFICTLIVACNTFVIKAILLRKRRRISNSSSSSSESSYREASPITEIDIRFSKLMALLSFIFVTCWMPQMISTVLALKSNPLAANHWFFKVAEFLMIVLFALDPYVYVFSGKNVVDCWGKCSRSRRTLRIGNEIRTYNTTSEPTSEG